VSTINAQNFGDGTDSVPASAVLQGTAKAWLEFDGTGTVATSVDYNVSSLSDTAVGNYEANFTNSFSSALYANAGTSRRPGLGLGIMAPYQKTASQGRIWVATAAGTFADNGDNSVEFWGDLA